MTRSGESRLTDSRLAAVIPLHYGEAMKILSSSFPAGPPGAGLLLLRFAVAAVLLSESFGHAWPIVIAAVVIAFSLTLGFLSMIAALLATALQTTGAFAAGTGTTGLVVASISQSLALALTGPGAYSLDARLFGRRLIFESRRKSGMD